MKKTIKDVVREIITEDMLIEHYDGIANGLKFISNWYMPEIKNFIIVFWYYEDINGIMCDDSRRNASKLHYSAVIYEDMEEIDVCDRIDITDFEGKGTEKLFAEFKELVSTGEINYEN